MHANVTIKNVGWLHFIWATLYVPERPANNPIILFEHLAKSFIYSYTDGTANSRGVVPYGTGGTCPQYL